MFGFGIGVFQMFVVFFFGSSYGFKKFRYAKPNAPNLQLYLNLCVQEFVEGK